MYWNQRQYHQRNLEPLAHSLCQWNPFARSHNMSRTHPMFADQHQMLRISMLSACIVRNGIQMYENLWNSIRQLFTVQIILILDTCGRAWDNLTFNVSPCWLCFWNYVHVWLVFRLIILENKIKMFQHFSVELPTIWKGLVVHKSPELVQPSDESQSLSMSIKVLFWF